MAMMSEDTVANSFGGIPSMQMGWQGHYIQAKDMMWIAQLKIIPITTWGLNMFSHQPTVALV